MTKEEKEELLNLLNSVVWRLISVKVSTVTFYKERALQSVAIMRQIIEKEEDEDETSGAD